MIETVTKISQKACKNITDKLQTGPFVLVIFGGVGDLSGKKLLPALYSLFQQRIIKDFSILGVDQREISDDKYRDIAKKSVKKAFKNLFSEEEWKRFSKKIFYERLSVEKEADCKSFCNKTQKLISKTKTYVRHEADIN